MHIQREIPDKHTIQSYTDSEIKVDSNFYQKSMIISPTEIIVDWPIQSIKEFKERDLELFTRFKPEIVIIGHNELGNQLPFFVMEQLSQQGIGIEAMSIGAASRTFNVLLSEKRDVVAGIIFP